MILISKEAENGVVVFPGDKNIWFYVKIKSPSKILNNIIITLVILGRSFCILLLNKTLKGEKATSTRISLGGC